MILEEEKEEVLLASDTPSLKMAMRDPEKDPLYALRTLQLSSLSEVEAESDVDVSFSIELSNPGSSRERGRRGNEESTPLMKNVGRMSSGDEEGRKLNVFTDPEYSSVIRATEEAMDEGVLPERIYQGSSGSYFVRNIRKENIGVFKPKDEEPYGHLNPKWTKWLHKICCPCCFGRSCLVPNQGYLSEVGASIVDERLGLNIVPKTKDRCVMVVKRSVSSIWPDSIGENIDTEWPRKVGSFQLFVKGYKDASIVLEEMRDDPPSAKLKEEFKLQFQRLVVLDYIIRNTDRGNDNWLVRYDRPSTATQHSLEVDGSVGNGSITEEVSPIQRQPTSSDSHHGEGCIKIAAIDNGLAFPFKHPDEWRTYPFYWAWLSLAREPFTDSICDLVLERLKSPQFVQSIVDDLRTVFSMDKGFDRDLFDKQMAVMRGQMLNLVNALEQRKTPWDLVQMPPVMIERVRIGRTRRFIQRFRSRTPFFQWC